jgi:phosphoglycolate phosphatase-like HAD superfamily hydrolase
MPICLFDIDGTLLASGGAGRVAMERALAEEFGVPASSEGVRMSGRTDRAIVRDLFALHRVAETPENLRRFLARYLANLPECLNSCEGRVLPGIAEFLGHLAGLDDVAVGLLTGNLREGARVKLGHFGLFEHFAFGGFGDEHFDRDDVAREALAATCRHLGCEVRGEQVWVIGDTPLDVRCARAIGARAVAVATGWHSRAELEASRPDLLLADLSDWSPLLDLWDD